MKKFKLALVIPWFGEDLKGGAEQQAWQIANRLADENCEISVLSTCCRSFMDNWEYNYYDEGETQVNNFKVHRFKVDKRDKKSFDKVVDKLLSFPNTKLKPGLYPITQAEEEIYWKNNISSSNLLKYIKDNIENYDFFIFMPYLFPPIQQGIEVVGHKAILQACLHDECYAYLQKTYYSILRCGGLFFNSRGEYNLAKKIYGEWITEKSFIIGEGIEFTEPAEADIDPAIIDGDYILYLGRRCSEKNTPMVIDAFSDYIEYNSSSLKLVLAGPAEIGIPENRNIIDLGLVDQKTKINLLSNCKALVNLSINESFSRVIFEAWRHRKPVIINRHCEATYTALIESNFAGYATSSNKEFEQILLQLEKADNSHLERLGELGYGYSCETSDWKKVMQRYLNSFAQLKTMQSKTQEVLFIYPHEIRHKQYEADLQEAIHSIRMRGIKTFLLSRIVGLASEAEQITLDKFTANRFSLLVYQGYAPWHELEEQIKGCNKILRLLEAQSSIPDMFKRVVATSCFSGETNDKELFFIDNLEENESLVLSDTATAPDLTSSLLYIFVRADFSNPANIAFLENVAKKFLAQYQKGIAFRVPKEAQSALQGTAANFCFFADSPIADELLKSDLIMIIENDSEALSIALKAATLKIPICLFNAPKLEKSLQIPTLSIEPSKVAMACAYIKLALYNYEFREQLLGIILQKKIDRMPGKLQSQYQNVLRYAMQQC